MPNKKEIEPSLDEHRLQAQETSEAGLEARPVSQSDIDNSQLFYSAKETAKETDSVREDNNDVRFRKLLVEQLQKQIANGEYDKDGSKFLDAIKKALKDLDS